MTAKMGIEEKVLGCIERHPEWSDGKIAFQVSSAASSGNIVVKVGGSTSNAIPFTVRPGHIYFVSPTGNDRQKGTFNSPWQTLAKAAATMQPGDIAY